MFGFFVDGSDEVPDYGIMRMVRRRACSARTQAHPDASNATSVLYGALTARQGHHTGRRKDSGKKIVRN
jgi:hypothetical protein